MTTVHVSSVQNPCLLFIGDCTNQYTGDFHDPWTGNTVLNQLVSKDDAGLWTIDTSWLRTVYIHMNSYNVKYTTSIFSTYTNCSCEVNGGFFIQWPRLPYQRYGGTIQDGADDFRQHVLRVSQQTIGPGNRHSFYKPSKGSSAVKIWNSITTWVAFKHIKHFQPWKTRMKLQCFGMNLLSFKH